MQERPETITVRTPEGRRAVLNADDFDPRAHEPWDDDSEAPDPETETLAGMSKAELKALARRKRIPGHGSWKSRSALRSGIANHLRKEG